MKSIGLVLAAGVGTRMKSKQHKVLHPICGKPMIGYVIETLQQLRMDRTVVIVGHGADAVREFIGSAAEFVHQEQQLGTGHAVLQAQSLLQHEQGTILILYGDTPLIRPSSLQKFMQYHQEQGAAGTVLTAHFSEPKGYGRIVRDDQDRVSRIVEEKDCTDSEAKIQEINTGMYCFDIQKLFAALGQVTNQNSQQEYYLTDVFSIMRAQGELIAAYCLEDAAESVGINDRAALAQAEKLQQQHILERHMRAGVTIIDPGNTYIADEVVIGIDTVIYPGTHLTGKTIIGEDCLIGPNTQIDDCVIANDVTIKQSVLQQAEVGQHTTIGPFANLRPGTQIGEKVKVGDFVEIKNARIDDGSKVPHLSYVGDAKVGKNVNIGCGAITVNYDGFNKHLTEIGDHSFIGSNVNLVAPIKVGEGAFVVAGSTITEEVEANSVSIARSRQTNKLNYVDKLKERLKTSSQTKNGQ